jgi:AAA+ ATPase superfamily predicted ATPase
VRGKQALQKVLNSLLWSKLPMSKQTFIDREYELNALKERYGSDKAEFIPIYGRRRVGKSELIKHFMNGKKGIYLLGKTISEKEILKTFSSRIAEEFKDEALEKNPFTNWEALLTYLNEKAKKQRMIVAFDEYPYLVKNNGALSSIFQTEWDERIKNSNMFLILSGSSIGMMEKEVLTHKAPLYGRRSGQLFLHPLKYKHVHEFLTKYSEESLVESYAILGGSPAYLLEFQKEIDVIQNIERNILVRDCYLFDEVPFLLKEELREPANYFAILKAISFGKTSLNDIVQETGLERGTAAKSLDSLIGLHLVERKVPVTEKHPHKSRRGIYRISDNFFRFWFRFVFPNKDLLIMDKAKDVLKNRIKPYLNSFVSFVFEDVCKEMLWEINGKHLFSFERIGNWWEAGSEIDIVALSDFSKDILFAECKWESVPIDVQVARELKEKSSFVMWNNTKRKGHFALFSKNGFTDECKAYCRENKMMMFDLGDIRKIREGKFSLL